MGCGDAEGTVGEFKFGCEVEAKDRGIRMKILWFRRVMEIMCNGYNFVMCL